MSFLNFEQEGKSSKHTTGAPSKRIQHPGRSPLRKTRLCARNANRAGPLSPSGPKVQGIAVLPVRHSRVWFLLPSEDAHTAGKESVCPLRARRSHPRKQQTSTWEQSGGSQPAPPPPTEAQVTTGEEAHRTGAARGFPKRWCRDHQASARGPPQQPAERGRVQCG